MRLARRQILLPVPCGLTEFHSAQPASVKGIAVQPAQLERGKEGEEQITLVFIEGDRKLSVQEQKRIAQWLEARTGTKIKLFAD